MTRRLLLIAALLAGALLVVILALPWWWGGLLRAAGSGRGLEFETYERLGYARWALQDVVWTGDGITIRIERFEAPHPLRWAIDGGESSPLVGGDWSVAVIGGADEAGPESESGWPAVREQLTQIHDLLVQWLPDTTLGAGRVSWPDGEIRTRSVRWESGRLDVRGLAFEDHQADVVVSWLEGADGPDVDVQEVDAQWDLQAAARGRRVEGKLVWQGQPADFSVLLPPTGWVPEEASLTTGEWELPGGAVKLGEQYTRVRGTLEAEWEGGRGTVRLDAAGAPRPGHPPLQARLRMEGDPARVTVHELEVHAPGLDAILTEPVMLDPKSRRAETEALFRLDADLAELPRSPATGRVRGRVSVDSRQEGRPRTRGSLSLEDVTVEGWTAGVHGEVEASLDWPRLIVESAQLGDAAGSEMAAQGEIDLDARHVGRAELSGRIAAASVARWLPEAVGFAQAEVEATATGPFDAIEHRGRAHADELRLEGFHALALGLEWSGRGREGDVQIAAETAGGAMTLAARIGEDAAVVEGWRVLRGGQEVFALMEPARIQWAPDWVIDPVRLRGRRLELAADLSGLADGRLAIDAPRLPLDWVNDWWSGALPVQAAHDLQLRGEIVSGRLQFGAAGQIELPSTDGHDLTLRMKISGDQAGVVIEQLGAGTNGETVARVTGRLPITIWPDRSPRWAVDEDAPLVLEAKVDPSPVFWEALARTTGVRVQSPRLEAKLGGTWGAPRGAARLTASSIERSGGESDPELPVVTNFDATLRGDGEGLLLEALSVDVEGQTLRASGRLPLTPEEWESAREAPLAYLRDHATGRLELPSAEVAAFARLIPDILAPTGRVQAALEFRSGGRIDGALRLRGAASRPLGPLGPLHEIAADLNFEGREIQVATLQARVGGQPVTLSGRAFLPASGPPRVELRLQGKNLPLVRQVGLLLRADLNLGLVTDESGNGQVSGEVRLRDGLFLADLQDIVPRGSGVSRPAARPPYFSVTIDPLHRWRLDVTVEGDEFLRLRTPLFQGLASARFQLGGTLSEPRAFGEVTVEEGTVRLPFATFAIDEGTVRLTQADPYQPQLSILGTTRRLGYELRMEVTGTAADPRLQFFSSPPLPSEEILLLVMAGQAPGGEVSYSGSQRAVQIGTFIGRGLIGDVFGGDGGSKLTVTTGERVSRQGRETYRFTYELAPRLSLVGEYDEFDSYNAGLRWRLLPRRRDSEEGGDDEAPQS